MRWAFPRRPEKYLYLYPPSLPAELRSSGQAFTGIPAAVMPNDLARRDIRKRNICRESDSLSRQRSQRFRWRGHCLDD